MMLVYSAGLRVSEIVKLKVENIAKNIRNTTDKMPNNYAVK